MSSNKSNEPSKVTGNVKYYQGAAKETAGKTLGNEQMQAEGKAKKAEGEGEYKAAQVQGQAEGFKDKTTGGLKAIGNEQMQGEGKVTKNAGEAKKEINK
ncbi:2825_t:CDS:2 [Funneliformis geosporum]|uniref:16849_t:CDS:1 n=1 Tax=Funneliformis geosporum TaxID=1117311 RepID=A0A9W4SMS9_9GLOM|nr:2825_t:CDS:2 [Funneliformis geosporum]CAI2175889.1 16849_t:CDS:2 [Funneliformis geosporum]